MKTILIGINAKYEHESLAVWYLKAACDKNRIPVTVMQFSINDSLQKIWSSILSANPDVAAFSCYIWNRELVLKIISDLKKTKPHCKIIVGGPEVSYPEAEKDYSAYGVNYLVKGAGEERFPLLLKSISGNPQNIGNQILEMEDSPYSCNNEYLSPFGSEHIARIKDRIAYIESSRGCPFRCSYCLSSESKGMIYYPINEIRSDLNKLVKAKPKVIKFIDRSFNVNEKHSLAIWEIIKELSDEDVVFHFEINPDILTPNQIESLSSIRPGLIQIEAGIQSVNAQTLNEVSRVMNVDKAINNLKTLMNRGNIHIHTDLIAGLPYDTLESFKEAFNRIYKIKAHHMQLGFLKLLLGTRIRNEAEEHGYKFRDYPPYEVIENKYISAEEILILKGVEEVLDRTWNSGRLTYTLDYLVDFFASPFNLYEEFAWFIKERGLLYQPMSAVSLFKLLREYALSVKGIDSLALDSLIALDYACSIKNTVIPNFLGDSLVKSIDIRAALGEYAPEKAWKNEYRKRFLLLEGKFSDRIIEKTNTFNNKNRILVDMNFIDSVTRRALPRQFGQTLYPNMKIE